MLILYIFTSTTINNNNYYYYNNNNDIDVSLCMQYVVVSLYRDCVWPGGGISVLLYFC